MNKIAKTLLMAVAIPFVALAQTARPVAIESESCFGKIHLDRAVYSIDDPLGVQAIHDLEGEVSGLKKFWTRGDGSNSIVSVQSDYVPPVFMWNGSGAEYTQYSSNLAFSAYAYAEGWGNRVGLKGYRYMNSGTVSNSLTFTTTPTGWEVGDVLSIINNKKYPDCVTISSIDGNVVKFNKNLPFTSIVAESQWDSKTAYVIAKPNVGNIDLGVSAHASGTMNKALNLFAYSEGFGNESLGQYSHTEGRNNVAYYASHAEGRENEASGEQSHAEGKLNVASGNRAHAEGYSTTASGQDAHSEGNSTVASANYSHSEGFQTKALGSCGHAEGAYVAAIGKYSHSEGFGSVLTTVPATSAEALNLWNQRNQDGSNMLNIAFGNYSHTEGMNNLATGDASHAEGQRTKSTGTDAHSEGRLTTASGISSHAEGMSSVASGRASHAEGWGSEAKGINAHAEGTNTLASGTASHASGINTISAGTGSFAAGMNTVSKGSYSFAIGQNTYVIGSYSHIEGAGTKKFEYASLPTDGVESDNLWNEGDMATTTRFSMAFGSYSHVEGLNNLTVANCSHAEGQRTKAKGNDSHSEGRLTQAIGAQSHAEGYGQNTNSTFLVKGNKNTKNYTTTAQHNLQLGTIVRYGKVYTYVSAIGGTTNFTTAATLDPSNALDRATIEIIRGVAYGAHSHVEGNYNSALGENSHAEGTWTMTRNNGEHAEGKYNKSNSDTIHSIGIGTSDTARTNAFEVTKTGTIYILVDGQRQSLQSLIAAAGQSGQTTAIETITANGVPLTKNGTTVEVPLQDYVRIDELQQGIKFNNMSVTNLTINGRKPSLEGHTHNLWEIPGAEAAATNAISKINAASDLPGVKAAMIEFLNNFKKPE